MSNVKQKKEFSENKMEDATRAQLSGCLGTWRDGFTRLDCMLSTEDPDLISHGIKECCDLLTCSNKDSSASCYGLEKLRKEVEENIIGFAQEHGYAGNLLQGAVNELAEMNLLSSVVTYLNATRLWIEKGAPVI